MKNQEESSPKSEESSPPPEGRSSQADRPSRGSLNPRSRSVARLRKRFGWVFVFAPLVFVLATDFLLRGQRIVTMPAKYMGSYVVAMVESACLWGALLWVTSARKGASRWVAAPVFAFLLTLSLGVQHYFHEQFSTYLNLDATLFGTNVAASAIGQVSADGKHFLKSMILPLALSLVFIWIGRRLIRPHRKTLRVARILAPIFVVAVFLIPCSYQRVQASTPDVIYFHAIGGLMKKLSGKQTAAEVRPGLRTPPALPALTSTAPIKRNVIMVLTESVRYDAQCSEHVSECPNAPKTNEAVPDRMPLMQLRSDSTTTAIELAVLWSGLQPIENREKLHGAPLLFDYAHAAGMETAYWTSHHMLFANSRLFVQDLPTRFQCGATDLDPQADMDTGGGDELLVARVKKEMPLLKEPFFAVVHVGNTHVPYRVDAKESPFQPSLPSKDPSDNEAYHNYYRNAVYLQDKSIADLLGFIHSQSFADHTVIFFTSDHGESFREHNQLGHTGSILDEELHVPGWIDAPSSALTPDEQKNLEGRKQKPLFHVDVTPTLLDLMGLWDSPALAKFKKDMVGESWIRPAGDSRDKLTLAMTNCTEIWGCAYHNWGMMRGFLKIEGREWEKSWHCYNDQTDPKEQNDLGPDGCEDLRDQAEKTFGGFPGDAAK